MPVTKRTTWKGQPSGTVATSANTGGGYGGSGEALASVVTGTGATTTFDNTHAPANNSPNGFRVATSGTSALANATQTIPASDIAFVSVYVYLTSYNAGSTGSNVIRFLGAGTQAARMRYSATGFIGIADTTTTNTVSMATVAAPLNQRFRVDIQVRVSTGAAQAWLYKTNPDALPGSGLHDDTVTTSGALYGANPVDTIAIGQVVAAASVPDTWWADFAVSDTAIPGPDPGPLVDDPRIPPWLLAALLEQRYPAVTVSTVQAGVGVGDAPTRPQTAAAGVKGAIGTAGGGTRATTSASGIKGGIGAGTAATRPQTRAAGAKGAIGAAAASAGPRTTAAGVKGAIGAAAASTRPQTATTGKPGKAGTGAASTRPGTASTATPGKAGTGRASTRATSSATASTAAPPTPAFVTIGGHTDATTDGGHITATTDGGHVQAPTIGGTTKAPTTGGHTSSGGYVG